MKLVDVTVIGGGPVGLFASFYSGLRGMSVRIVDSLDTLGGQLTALYPEKYVYDVGGLPKVLAKDLAASLIEQGTQFAPELSLGETAAAIERVENQWVITTASGKSLPTGNIIISAGAGAFHPTKMGVEREEELTGKGVFYGVQNKAQFAGKELIIVGGGDSAFDWALDLEPVAKGVTIVHRRDQFRAHEDTVKKVQATGVKFKLWSVTKALHGNGSLSGVTIENTQTKEQEELAADALIVNIGFKSDLGPIKTWGLELEKNQIKVDHLCRTNLPGVFAVGDVCTFEGKLKLIATGFGEAATAVCVAKTLIDPQAKLFPGHSSDMDVPAGQS